MQRSIGALHTPDVLPLWHSQVQGVRVKASYHGNEVTLTFIGVVDKQPLSCVKT